MSRYIDADALMERLERKKCEPAKVRYTEGYNDALMRFRSMVHGAPTVDAVPVRHGEWKPHPIKGCEEWDVCSACGIGTHRRLVSDLGEEEYSYSYCPWCGAKMDGEQ